MLGGRWNKPGGRVRQRTATVLAYVYRRTGQILVRCDASDQMDRSYHTLLLVFHVRYPSNCQWYGEHEAPTRARAPFPMS